MITKYVDGKYIPLTDKELAAMQPHPIDWHCEKPFRVTVNNDTWKDWFAKKRDHADYFELTGQQLYPDLIALLEIVKSIDNTNIINDNDNTYIYLDEVFDCHIPIISKYNAIVETKPI